MRTHLCTSVRVFSLFFGACNYTSYGIYMHSQIQAYRVRHTHIYTYTFRYICICVYVYIYTYIYIYIYANMCNIHTYMNAMNANTFP